MSSHLDEELTDKFAFYFPLKVGAHTYGIYNLVSAVTFTILAVIAGAHEDSKRLWWISYFLVVSCPGLLNYASLFYSNYSLFWRQQTELTAWYQVIISFAMHSFFLLMRSFNNRCNEIAQVELQANCNMQAEIKFLRFLIAVIVSLSLQIYLAYTMSLFTNQYKKEFPEECEENERLLFAQGRQDMRAALFEMNHPKITSLETLNKIMSQQNMFSDSDEEASDDDDENFFKSEKSVGKKQSNTSCVSKMM